MHFKTSLEDNKLTKVTAIHLKNNALLLLTD